MSLFSRFLIETRDRLFYDATLRHWGGRLSLSRVPRVSPASTADEVVASIKALCRWSKLLKPESAANVLAEIRRRSQLTLGKQIDWQSHVHEWTPDRMEKAVIAKPYVSDRERGVIYVAFENQWMRLLNLSDAQLRDFANRYTLVLGPTTSPPYSLETTLFCARYPDDTLFSLISNPEDVPALRTASEKIRPVPLYASSWVHPDRYPSVTFGAKDIDIVMVANFNKYKRHFALFRALRDIPSSVRVQLVGQPDGGRDLNTLLGLARQFGVENRFQVTQSASHELVMQTLARARISVILTRLEGACLAVVESMFADTPIAIYDDAIIGSRVYVNEHTGRFLRRRSPLAPQLMEFLAESGKYSPRKWVLDNGVSCTGSTKVLNQTLKDAALASGKEWTQDLAVFHRRPEPRLLRQEDRDRLRPAYEDFSRRYGITISMG